MCECMFEYRGGNGRSISHNAATPVVACLILVFCVCVCVIISNPSSMLVGAGI